MVVARISGDRRKKMNEAVWVTRKRPQKEEGREERGETFFILK
jgi:hypothetical protein